MGKWVFKKQWIDCGDIKMKKPIEILREARDQISRAIDKLEERPDVNRTDYNREYELGVCYIFPNGAIFRYGKIDFGVLAYEHGLVRLKADILAEQNLDEIRSIQYKWFAMNAMARISRHQL